MIEIYFERQNKNYPFYSAQIADLLDSFLVDWRSCKSLVYALISSNDPLITAVILLRSQLPKDDLLKLWQKGDDALRVQLLFYDKFLINFNTSMADELGDNPYILAALASRWNFITDNISKKNLSAKARARMESLITASNEVVRKIWNAANGNKASAFLEAYLEDPASIDFEAEAKFNTKDLELLPYLYPLALVDLINNFDSIDNKEAKDGLIGFVLHSPCALYRLALAEALEENAPEMKKLAQDPDGDIAAVAQGKPMTARHRHTFFMIYDSESPRKLSRKEEEDFLEDESIRRISNFAIPDTESLAIFEFIFKNKTFQKNPLMGEGSTGFTIAEVVEKYVDERLTLEANWNLKVLRGLAEKVFMCIGKDKLLLPFQLLLAIAHDCVYNSNATSLAQTLYELPSSHIQALIIENSKALGDGWSKQTDAQLDAWQRGNSLILRALLNAGFTCHLTDDQAREIIALNDPLMLRSVSEAINCLADEDAKLSKNVFYDLVHSCAHSQDPRVRDSLYENLDALDDEERLKYNLQDIFNGLEPPKETDLELTGQEIARYLHNLLNNSES